MYYIFDGTYFGLLTCVFDAFASKDKGVRVVVDLQYMPDMFSQSRKIATDIEKANRILKGLTKHLSTTEAREFYRAYLSENAAVFQVIFDLIVRGFSADFSILQDYGNKDVMLLSHSLRQVGREHHRMKAFIRFQKSNDGLYFAMIDPDFNVLPLLSSFFKNRYTDQRWMIYDVKRNYGLHYDLKVVAEVQLLESERESLVKTENTIELDDTELKYQRLWKHYFKSTNIEARKNMKLHIQHVPKRYWKYLIEKQSL